MYKHHSQALGRESVHRSTGRTAATGRRRLILVDASASRQSSCSRPFAFVVLPTHVEEERSLYRPPWATSLFPSRRRFLDTDAHVFAPRNHNRDATASRRPILAAPNCRFAFGHGCASATSPNKYVSSAWLCQPFSHYKNAPIKQSGQGQLRGRANHASGWRTSGTQGMLFRVWHASPVCWEAERQGGGATASASHSSGHLAEN